MLLQEGIKDKKRWKRRVEAEVYRYGEKLVYYRLMNCDDISGARIHRFFTFRLKKSEAFPRPSKEQTENFWSSFISNRAAADAFLDIIKELNMIE